MNSGKIKFYAAVPLLKQKKKYDLMKLRNEKKRSIVWIFSFRF